MSRSLARRTQWLIVCGLVVGLGALGLASVWSRRATDESKAHAAEPTVPRGMFRPTGAQWAGLRMAPVELRRFPAERVTDGRIANDDDATTLVFSPYSGRVTRIFVKAGDHVKKGAPLLELEASEVVQGQTDLVSAVSALATARAQLDLARTNEKRQHDLFAVKGGALKDWQQSKVDLATAEGNFRSAEISLEAVQNRLRILGKSDAEIGAIEHAPDRLRMSPEAVVYAPITGVVTQRAVGVGQYIQSGAANAPSPSIFAIGDMSKVWLVANMREEDAPKMHLGDPVEVHVLAFPGRVFAARLSYVAASIDPNTHRLPVRAEIDNPDGALKPEMFANFSIITGKDAVAPSVPEDAVVYDGETARVWVARADKLLALRDIRVGRVIEGRVEVLDGLVPGETVVTSGSLFIDRAARTDR